jgi:hypothetical protein
MTTPALRSHTYSRHRRRSCWWHCVVTTRRPFITYTWLRTPQSPSVHLRTKKYVIGWEGASRPPGWKGLHMEVDRSMSIVVVGLRWIRPSSHCTPPSPASAETGARGLPTTDVIEGTVVRGATWRGPVGGSVAMARKNIVPVPRFGSARPTARVRQGTRDGASASDEADEPELGRRP